MLSLDGRRRIWLCTIPTDMRRSFDGLSALVRNELGVDPTSGNWFAFVNRRTMMKVLAFDGDGYWIWSKRLEVGRFATRGETGTGKVALSRTALLALIERAPTSSSNASENATEGLLDGAAAGKIRASQRWTPKT